MENHMLYNQDQEWEDWNRRGLEAARRQAEEAVIDESEEEDD